MYTFLFLLFFSALVFLTVLYKPDHKLKAYTNLIKRHTSSKKNIHPLMVGLGLLVFLVLTVLGLKALFQLVNHRIEFLYIPVITLGYWFFIRDLDIFNHLEKRVPKYPKMIIHLMLAILGGYSWYLIPGWLFYNLAAFIVCVVAIRAISPIPIKYLIWVLVAIVLYDFWGVIISGAIVDVATNSSDAVRTVIPPVLVVVPYTGHILGSGDIVLSGLAIVSAAYYKLEKMAFVGYALGLALVLIALNQLQMGLPAMVFLAPTILLSLYISKARRMSLGLR